MMKNILTILLLLFANWLYGQQPRLVLPIGHNNWITSSAFSPDGQKVVTASMDNTARVWNAKTGILLAILSHKNAVNSAFFSANGQKLITASADHTACIWNAETGILLATLRGRAKSANYDVIEVDTGVDAKASFSPDGEKVITTFNDSAAYIWSGQTGALLFAISGHGGHVNSATFSPDGQKIVTTSDDGIVRIWDARNGTLMTTISMEPRLILSASFSPDAQKVVTTSNDSIVRIWNAHTGFLLSVLSGHRDMFGSVSFSPDGQKVIKTNRNNTVSVWNAETASLLTTLSGHTAFINSANFSPDGQKVVTASGDRTARVWDAETGKSLIILKGHTGIVIDAVFSPDGQEVITASQDKTGRIWNLETGQVVCVLSGHTSYVSSAFFSTDGQNIITASEDNAVRIWSAQTGTLEAVLKGHTRAVRYATFSPDKKKAVSFSDDSTARIWNAQTGKLLFTLKGHAGVVLSAAFSSDGQNVITTSYENALIWSAQTGLLLTKLNTRVVLSATFSPDGWKVVTVSANTYIWDVRTGGQLAVLRGHTSGVYSAIFTPDGQKVITHSRDGTVCRWSALTGNFLAIVKKNPPGKEENTNSIDGKKALLRNDNTIAICDNATRSFTYTFFSIDSSDYFGQIPSGYYQCSPYAAKLLHYVTPDLKVITFEQLDVKYNRPDKVLEALGNTDTNLINSYKFAYYKRIKKLGIDTAAFTDGYTVPEADFVNRDSVEYEPSSGNLQLHIAGADSAIALDRFNIWVNESPVFGVRGLNIKARKTHKIDTTIIITLSQGKNTIETSVTNVNATESYRKPLVVNYTPANVVAEKVYFIGIGIDHFRDNSYNLQWSVKDIRDEAKALKKKFGERCIVVDTLFNERVTTTNVLELKKKLQQTTVNDKVIIAYSGHGLFSKDYDYYLSTYNINFSNPQEGGLPYDELENLLDSIPARKKLMLLDACHSGEVDKDELVRIATAKDELAARGVRGLQVVYDTAGKKLGMKNSFELMQSLFVNVGRNTGAAVISAAGGTQFAYERGELGNGVFTHCILEEMNTDHLPVSKLQQEVSAKVSDLTAGLQVPTARSETKEVDWEVW